MPRRLFATAPKQARRVSLAAAREALAEYLLDHGRRAESEIVRWDCRRLEPEPCDLFAPMPGEPSAENASWAPGGFCVLSKLHVLFASAPS